MALVSAMLGAAMPLATSLLSGLGNRIVVLSAPGNQDRGGGEDRGQFLACRNSAFHLCAGPLLIVISLLRVPIS